MPVVTGAGEASGPAWLQSGAVAAVNAATTDAVQRDRIIIRKDSVAESYRRLAALFQTVFADLAPLRHPTYRQPSGGAVCLSP